MAKYKHHPDTLIALNDLENRVMQLEDAAKTADAEWVDKEIQTFQAVRAVIRQVKKHGHVFRGSSAVPDGLLAYTNIPAPTEQLRLTKEGNDELV